MNQPSVGRAVHYTARGSADGVYPKACRHAVITEVDHLDVDALARPGDQPNVGAQVVNPTGQYFHPLTQGGGLRYDGGHSVHGGDTHLCDGLDYQPGSWHWPARTP